LKFVDYSPPDYQAILVTDKYILYQLKDICIHYNCYIDT